VLSTQQRGDLGDGQDEHQVEEHLGPADVLVRYVHLRSFRAGLQWRRRVRRVANIADVGVGHGQSGPDAVVAGQFEQVHPDNGPVEDPVPILVPINGIRSPVPHFCTLSSRFRGVHPPWRPPDCHSLCLGVALAAETRSPTASSRSSAMSYSPMAEVNANCARG
jgi:hypothetical protein